MVANTERRTLSVSSMGSSSAEVGKPKVLYSSSTGKLKFVHGFADESDGHFESGFECCGCKIQEFRQWLLRTTFLVVVAIALLFCGLIMHFSVFGGEENVYTEGDMIFYPVSTYFCSGVKYTAHGRSNFSIHSLPGQPSLSQVQRSYKVGKVFTLPSWSYQYWGLTLLKGSVLSLKLCSDQFIDFSVLKGQQSLQEWTQTLLYQGYFYRRGIPASKGCDLRHKYHYVSFVADESDLYYILFSSSSGFSFMTTVSTYLFMNRTVYNLTDGISVLHCNRSASCTSSLRYKSYDAGVIEILGNNGKEPDPFQTVRIESRPVSRLWFYICLFGGIFAGIFVATILYSIWRACVKIQPKEKETAPLLGHGRSYKGPRRKIPPRTRKPSPWIVCIPEENEKDYDQEHKERGPSLTSQPDFDTYSSYSLLLTSYDENTGADSNVGYAHRPSIGDTREDEASHYQSQRQLMDSCMTSASISAI